MNDPRVTIVMTAWNRAEMIGPAIRSALRSEYEDFELLVVDNASDDETVAVARRVAGDDPRVTIHVNERNLGDYGNRNRGLELARGEFLKYLDSDDLFYAHTLHAWVPMLDAEPGAAFALSTGHAWPGGPCPMRITPRLAYEREFLGAGLFHCGPGSALFRTEALRDLGGFEDVGPLSDFHFYLNAFKRVDAVLVPADLFWTRVHPGQELRSQRVDSARREAMKLAWETLLDKDIPLATEDLPRARGNHLASLLRLASRDLRRGRLGSALHWLGRTGPRFGHYVRDLRHRRRDAFAGVPRTASGEYVLPRSLLDEA